MISLMTTSAHASFAGVRHKANATGAAGIGLCHTVLLPAHSRSRAGKLTAKAAVRKQAAEPLSARKQAAGPQERRVASAPNSFVFCRPLIIGTPTRQQMIASPAATESMQT